jgi:pyruvate/2-oxoglutarate dehydrogenase complex dihydrolipoamide dehydrogenase (E3) component
MDRFDFVVIGDGAAGDSIVRPAAGAGKRVALFEHDRLGGECLNYGCVPSKVLYQSAEVFHQMRNAGEFGVRASGVEIDFPAVIARAQAIIETIRGDNPWGGVRADGITAFRSTARFVGPHELDADGERVEFDQVAIATGTKAGIPPVPGLAEAVPLTNETIFKLSTLPPRLAVIGAGSIGAELAQIFARFGSQVTLLEMLPQVVPTEDEEIANVLQRVLHGDGVHVYTSAQIENVSRNEDGSRTLLVSHEGDPLRIDVDEVLVAAGRVPQTADLNLEAAGVESQRGWITVDKQFRTSAHHIWAAGDVTGGMQFTHVASEEGSATFRNAILGESREVDTTAVPYGIFTDPEIGHVGMTEREVLDADIDHQISRFSPPDIDRSIIANNRVGLIKLIATPGGEQILGAHIIAARGADLINEFALAMANGLSVAQIAHTIHAYPTLPESIRWASTSLIGE